MLYFILSIFLLIFLKFIYDSFFTNNAEENWDKFKADNPNQAVLVDTNKGLNMNINAKVRTDGFYLCKHEFFHQSERRNMTMYFYLLFSRRGAVVFEEIDSKSASEMITIARENEDYRRDVINFNNLNEIEYSPNSTSYKVKNGGVEMKFFDPNDFLNRDNTSKPSCYTKLYGTIVHNGLILEYENKYFNYSLKKLVVKKLAENLKFNFYPVNF